jgi:exosome complex RNA-binding protein Rrp42 (RNase PH superfamily)
VFVADGVLVSDPEDEEEDVCSADWTTGIAEA